MSQENNTQNPLSSTGTRRQIGSTSYFKSVLATCFLLSFIIETGLITIPFAAMEAGFWPSVFAIVVSWGYLLCTGLYYLELIQDNPPGANLFSFAKRYINPLGARFSSAILAIVSYGYLIYFFYLAAPILMELLSRLGLPLSQESVLLLLGLILAGSVALGLFFSALLNFFLLLATFAIIYLCFYFGPHLHAEKSTLTWSFLFIVFPSMINSLYYNTLLPTIAPLLNYETKKIRTSVITALSIATLLFIAWFFLVIHIEGSYVEGLTRLNPNAITFTALYKTPYIGKWLPALLTLNVVANSLIVGSLMVDFLSDLLKIPLQKRRGRMRLAACALIFIPPVGFNIIPSKSVYLAALYITEAAPLYLNGLLPVLCVWSLRYFYQTNHPPLVWGGKPLVLLVGAFSCFVLYLVGLEIFYQTSF